MKTVFYEENINNIQKQGKEKLFKENHKHRFQFSHTTMEARGEQAIYMTIKEMYGEIYKIRNLY